ncbi:MAG: ferrous iron transport protein B [Bacteroidetes bacterium HGW-Bacteroidetes-20]|nr:MAG: ferrous iron transport protein B [Bacteroidetes bacterium HGW-Bacteroidetes-20]
MELDKILSHKILGYVVFLALMWLMFFSTFILGRYPQEGILWLLEQLSLYIASKMDKGLIYSFLSDGVIAGVGSVLSFLPNILILFFFIYVFEETKYMQRVAKLLDNFMHKIGLHGNSFIPMLMGFGCNVPAILATKSIPDRKQRLLTMLLIPFMSCSARLPLLVLMIGTFFPENPLLVLFSLYFSGILIAIVTAILLNKFIFKTEEDLSPVLCDPLRKPPMRIVLKQMWEATEEYLKKIGTVVLLAMMVIWFLSHFPQPKETKIVQSTPSEQNTSIDSVSTLNVANYTSEIDSLDNPHETYMYKFGVFITPIMKPLGFDWKMSVCLVSGLAAKEFIVGTMAVLYRLDDDSGENSTQIDQIRNAKHTYGPDKGKPVFTLPIALSFLVFSMIYMPCIATFLAIKKESESWKWAFFSIIYSTSIAWIAAFVVFNVSKFFL